MLKGRYQRVKEWSINIRDQPTHTWDAEETIHITSLFMEDKLVTARCHATLKTGPFWINPVCKKLANFLWK